MKKRNLLIVAALASAQLAVVALLTVGCETESVTQTDITVSPAYSEISKGQSVTLRASGWSAYRWAVADENQGYLSAKVGVSVVYTAISTNFTQVITASADTAIVTSTGGGTNGSVTTTSVPFSGTARVRHR
jgi:hypothetical protein